MKSKILLLLFLLLIPFFAYAEQCDSSKISISSISIDEDSSDDLEVNPAEADGKTINLALNMSEVGENIRYQIVIKNDSKEDYELEKNDFNISTDYVDYSFESEDQSNIIKANSSKTIYLKVEYKNEIPDDVLLSGTYNDNQTMVVNLISEEAITNPNTGIVLFFLIVFVLIISNVIVLTILGKKNFSKALLFLLAALIIIPFKAKAICKYDIIINSDVQINKYNMCVTFSNDYDWGEIIDAINLDHTDCMNVGDTKEIDLGEYGTHVVRISNMSTPEECQGDNFSQTACGFVIEFKDIILKRRFNATNSNAGGWRDSEIRPFLNNEIFNAIPEDLRNAIIETDVISGHEKNVADNYYTTDKIYLLSTSEVWLKDGTSSDTGYDAADTLTRQLDYYHSIGVTSSNYQGADKLYNNSSTAWWLRTAHKNSANYVGNVLNGKTNAYHGHATLINGISPAFRVK